MRDLLEITRLEAGVTPPRFELLAARSLVKSAVEAVASQAEAKGLALTWETAEELPPVRADQAQITRVLINLINNAVRHTSQGGEVDVRAQQEGDLVRFQVRDTGVGIPKEYLGRIFERFAQVPGATRGGAGLGLSIAQSILKAHQGEIHVESEPGKGSVFSFTLPIGTGKEIK